MPDRSDHVTIFSQNQQQPPLLSLPPELRNDIYKYTCAESSVIFLAHGRPSPITPTWLVCRQPHKETGLLHLELNTISTFNRTLGGLDTFRTFKDGLSPVQRGAVRHVALSISSLGRILSAAGKQLETQMADTTKQLVVPFRDLMGLEVVDIAVRKDLDKATQAMLHGDLGRSALVVSAQVQIKLHHLHGWKGRQLPRTRRGGKHGFEKSWGMFMNTE